MAGLPYCMGGLHCPWPGIELKRMKILKKKFAI